MWPPAGWLAGGTSLTQESPPIVVLVLVLGLVSYIMRGACTIRVLSICLLDTSTLLRNK
jgi:hypothetical protein